MSYAVSIVNNISGEMTKIASSILSQVIKLDLNQTLGLSVVVLLVGLLLVKNIKFLSKFCIPAPVVGGLIFSIIALIGHQTGAFDFAFDTTIKDFFMICFFASVGFGANLSVLKSGGPAVVKFLIITIALVICQNILGVGIAVVMQQNPLLGMATGSIPMVGGHGTSAAFGPVLEKAGLPNGSTLAVAAATFGLISGSLIGGPTAKRLIEKKNLTPALVTSGDYVVNEEVESDKLTASGILIGFYQIAIAVGLGSIVSLLLKKALPALTFPPYIGAMLVAVVMRNVFTEKSKIPTRTKEIGALGDVFLAIFLAQALMVLKLWELAELALPLIVILVAQVAFVFLWATFVTFNVMGRDYDAAVLAAGNCGFGLGATPNAMANMSAVTSKYGPSPKAFFILPIIGSLFIDVFNSFIITMFISFVGKIFG